MIKTLHLLCILTPILTTYCPNVSAENSLESKQALAREESIQYANEILKVTKGNFSCAGIGLFDNGSSIDGPIYFFKNDTRELICISAMGECVAADAKQQNACRQICPPPEWKSNNCDTKYKNR
jgi:hypothetical protein